MDGDDLDDADEVGIDHPESQLEESLRGGESHVVLGLCRALARPRRSGLSGAMCHTEQRTLRAFRIPRARRPALDVLRCPPGRPKWAAGGHAVRARPAVLLVRVDHVAEGCEAAL